MRSIRKVLTTVRFAPEDLETLREIFAGSAFVHVEQEDTDGIRRELKDADVAVLDGDLDDRFLGENRLKWIHCNHAGLNKSARPEIFERGILLTGSAGRSSPVLAEHCIYFMLNACYHTRELLEAQQRHAWLNPPALWEWRGLYGRTAGIVGMGNTGKMLAERLHAMGMSLITYTRHLLEGYDYIERKLYASAGDDPGILLSQSDFVILCVALTDDTYHLINENTLKQMKDGAVLVNLCRGQVVDTQALIQALDSGKLSCAGLDVFEQEPLPADDPLWDRKDVYITPHSTPAVPHRAGRCLDIIRENVRRYKAEEPMLNQVKPEDVYTHL